MNPNYPQEIYKTSDLEELNQKIQNRFIRDVVKPYSNSIKRSAHAPARYRNPKSYEIPKSSEFFTSEKSDFTSKTMEPYIPFTYDSRQQQQQQRQQQRRVVNHDKNPYNENYVGPQQSKFTPIVSASMTPAMTPAPSNRISMNTPSFAPTTLPVIVKESVDCRNVHQHASNCPVCAKIYRSNYSIFMVIIVILVLIILFLAKKCLNTS
jgi:hypothetical protein